MVEVITVVRLISSTDSVLVLCILPQRSPTLQLSIQAKRRTVFCLQFALQRADQWCVATQVARHKGVLKTHTLDLDMTWTFPVHATYSLCSRGSRKGSWRPRLFAILSDLACFHSFRVTVSCCCLPETCFNSKQWANVLASDSCVRVLGQCCVEGGSRCARGGWSTV